MTNPERTFARIETALKGYLRILPAGRFTPLFASGTATAPARLPDSVRASLPEGMAQFMESMDEKLESILALLNQQSLHDDFPVHVLIHDISGAGLRFTCTQPFELGTAVEVVVALGSNPKVLADTLGAVIRQDEFQGQTLWAMEFKEMRDSEREKIVQYVVSQQREQLRDRRLSPTT